MRRRAAVLLIAAACAACGHTWRRTYVLATADGVAFFHTPQAQLAARTSSLADLSRRELACPTATVERIPATGVACIDEWLADGCGRHASYLIDREDEGEATALRHRGGRILADLTVIVAMSHDARETSAANAEIVHALGLTGQLCTRDIDRYFQLQADGARDLDCPRTQVLPLVFPRGTMAEGCGKRATYGAGGRLAATVPIK